MVLARTAALLVLAALLVANARAAEVAEYATTEALALITRVERSGATFVRNGSEYSAAEAADHLRTKVKGYGKPITTEQFVGRLASRSSVSGKAYELRFSDGSSMTVEDWMRKELAAIRRSSARRALSEDSSTSGPGTRKRAK